MSNEQPRPLAVVTGASSGIGLELAKELARNGHDLVITAEDQAGLAEADRALHELAQGARVEAITVDLADRQGVETLHARIRNLGRPVEVLAANAGVGVGGEFARETDLEAELKLIQLNVTSQVHLIKLVARDMVERGSGRILITSSIASLMPGPFEAVYAASKAFLRSFGQAIRNELKDQGVGVTVLMPGPTETEFFHRAGMDDTKVGQGKKDDPADVARAAFKALMADKDHVVTGAKNKLQAAATTVLPDTARAALHRQQSEPQR
jgi:short-subunit dehydrogenase